MANFSSGNYAVLPANADDLEHIYDAADLSAVETNDNVNYVGQDASGEYAIHQAKFTTTGQTVDISWNGKSTVAPSSVPVVLQVYNIAGSWETIDTESLAGADTDFDLTGTGVSTTGRLDGSNVITFRVYQAASALNSDYAMVFLNSGTINDLANSPDVFYVSYIYDSQSALINPLICPKAGTITAVALEVRVDGTLASAGSVAVVIRKNNTTDYSVGSMSWDAAKQTLNNESMNVPLSLGDQFEIKYTTPSWVTIPTNVYMRGSIYITVI